MVYEHTDMTCPHCGSNKILFDHIRGEYVCSNCGTVISDKIIDVGREWRIFNLGDIHVKSRTGRSLTNALHDKGLATTFSARSPRLSNSMKKKMRKMKRVHNKIRISKKEKHVVTGLKYLNEYASRLSIPSYVREEAARILQKALENANVKVRTIKAMAAAAILIACKTHGVPKTLRIISKELGMTERELWHAERRILESVKKITNKLPEPKDFIPQIISKLNLSPRVQFLAAYISWLIRKKELISGRGPLGVAAASVYVASILLDEKKTQQEVASACDTTDVTIRNRYGDIVENLDITVML